MNIDEIMKNWAEDSVMDDANPIGETVKTGKLHSKYMNMLVGEALRFQSISAEVKKLKLAKFEYYTGEMAQEDLKARNWTPVRKRIVKTEAAQHIEADQDIIDLSLRMGLAKQKVDFLEEVIKQINNRSFNISNIINWEKFRNGG